MAAATKQSIRDKEGEWEGSLNGGSVVEIRLACALM